MSNRLQELAILSILILFFYGSFQASYQLKQAEWWKWFSLPLLFVLFIIITWSSAFSFHAETSLLPSIFASREFLLFLLAPTVFFLYLSGIAINQITNSIFIGASLAVVSYIFFYFRIDMAAAYIDTSSYYHYLVTYDESRGFRLKPPTYAVVITVLFCLFYIPKSGNLSRKLLALIGLTMCVYVWSLVQLRALAAGIIVSYLLLITFWSNPVRSLLVLAVIPIFAVAMAGLFNTFMDIFLQSHGADVRLMSYKLAIDQFKEHWLLGWGQSSGFSKTYQDLFGPKFYPSDLGIIGILFKYGVVGGLLYVFSAIWLLVASLECVWRVNRIDSELSPFFKSLLVFSTMMAINMVLWPGLAYGQGITMAAIIVGLTKAVREAETRQSTVPNSYLRYSSA